MTSAQASSRSSRRLLRTRRPSARPCQFTGSAVLILATRRRALMDIQKNGAAPRRPVSFRLVTSVLPRRPLGAAQIRHGRRDPRPREDAAHVNVGLTTFYNSPRAPAPRAGGRRPAAGANASKRASRTAQTSPAATGTPHCVSSGFPPSHPQELSFGSASRPPRIRSLQVRRGAVSQLGFT